MKNNKFYTQEGTYTTILSGILQLEPAERLPTARWVTRKSNRSTRHRRSATQLHWSATHLPECMHKERPEGPPYGSVNSGEVRQKEGERRRSTKRERSSYTKSAENGQWMLYKKEKTTVKPQGKPVDQHFTPTICSTKNKPKAWNVPDHCSTHSRKTTTAIQIQSIYMHANKIT